MNKIIIIAIVILVSVLSIACEQDYAGSSIVDDPNMVRQIQEFDMEGETIRVTNDTERKLVVASLYLPEGDDYDVQIYQVTFQVTGGQYIDWDATVISLDAMLLSPEIQVKDREFNKQDVTLTWENLPWQPNVANRHDIGFSIMFKEDVDPGTIIEFWTKSVVFETRGEESVYLRGYRDIDLGEAYYSGVMYLPVLRGDEPEEFQAKVPRIVVEE